MKRVVGGERMKWAHALAKHWVVGVLGIAVIAFFGVTILAPDKAVAAPNPAPGSSKWLNRSYIVGDDKQNYFDGNTFDNTFEYVQDTTLPCPNKITFENVEGGGGGSNTDTNVVFYYADNFANFYNPRLTIGEQKTNSAGQKYCDESNKRNIAVNDPGARRFTFYKNNNDQIINMMSGATFSRKGDYHGTARYFRDSEVADTGNSCPDMILLHAANPMSSGEILFGRGDKGGSSMLFAVEKNNDLSRVSESYDLDSEPNNIARNTCHVKSDSLNHNKSGEYSQYASDSNQDDQYFLSAGLDETGATHPSGDYEDDAFITFIGTIDNLPKDATDTPIQTPTDPGTSGDKIDDQVCKGGAMGWIVCPIISAIQSAVDLLRDIMQYFLTVNPLPIGSGPIYESWSNIRNFSNIAFAIAFFAIIFSQATSVGISNYGIKRLLPRLIAVAIATNLSYFICSFLIDIFNIMGVGITALFAAVNGGSFGTVDVSNGAGLIFTGGLIAGIAWAFSTGAIVEIVPLIVAAFIGFFVTFIVLVARQAVLILLVVFSPLAFVAALLPGTQNLFRRWFDVFVALLLMYPMIMGLFAAARLTSAILTAAGG